MLGRWRARLDISMRSKRILKHSLEGKGEIELGLLSVLVRAGETSLDIGANKGVYTYQLAQWGRTIAFEPIPQLADQLTRAAYPNVTVEQCVLCEKPGTQILHVPYHTKKAGTLNTPSASLRDQEAEGMLALEVEAKTLDSFRLEEVGFMKIDVEGWEENALHGARETIRRNQPTIMAEFVEAYAPGVLTRVPRFFDELGYKGFSIDSAALRLVPLSEIDPSRPVNENYIFVPAHDAEAFRSRCQALLRQRA